MSFINEWRVIGDTIIWGVKIRKQGKLTVAPIMAVLPEQDGSEIEIHVSGETKTLTIHSTGSLKNFERQGGVEFKIDKTGTQIVKLTI
ncbi:MAG: hypothetical protein J7L95_03390 [Prolixibacteraceae bacterium]|nr:hypothetical protein [Prolixibacteraceae bacterium]